MKYEVFVSQTGYIEVEADNKDDALKKTLDMNGTDVSWSDYWEVNAIQESEE